MTISCWKWLKTAFDGGNLWSTALQPKDDDEDIIFYNTVNPLINPPEGLFISSPFEEGLNRDAGLIWGGGGGGGVILKKTMVSVLYKELEYKVEKLRNQKVGGHAAEDQNQIADKWTQSFTVVIDYSLVFISEDYLGEGRGGGGGY